MWETTSEALALSDPEGVVLAVTPAYCALYGSAPETLIGQSFAVMFPKAERADAMAQYRAVFAAPDAPRSYEARGLRPDGGERVVEARAEFLVHDGQRVAMVSAIRDITERTRLERAQQDFVAMASHDLAAPVTVLRARAQLLKRRQAYDEAGVDAILEQTARMERLITDLRALVQVEGGGLAMQRQPVDLIDLAQAAVERARTLTTTHPVRLSAPETPVVVIGDRDRLRQILDNLLGNAVKDSPPGGVIVVRVEVSYRDARVIVADEGPGIPADVLPHVFERFYRGQHAAGDAGLGLGLYIARMLVEAHGGGSGLPPSPGRGAPSPWRSRSRRVIHPDSVGARGHHAGSDGDGAGGGPATRLRGEASRLQGTNAGQRCGQRRSGHAFPSVASASRSTIATRAATASPRQAAALGKAPG